MRTHKMVIIKAKPGHNPMQALCDPDEFLSYMARDWKDVTCGRCFRIKKQEKKVRRKSRQKGQNDG